MNTEPDPNYTPCHFCQLPVHADRATWKPMGNDLVPLCEKCASKAPSKAKKATKTPKGGQGKGARPGIKKWRLYRAMRHELEDGSGYHHFFLQVMAEDYPRWLHNDITVQPDGRVYRPWDVENRWPTLAKEVFERIGRAVCEAGGKFKYQESGKILQK